MSESCIYANVILKHFLNVFKEGEGEGRGDYQAAVIFLHT